MSALRNRAEGARRAGKRKASDLVGPALGLVSDGRPGEHRLNRVQMNAIEQLFQSHPAISAARAILHGQLLAGGIEMRRDGEKREVKPAFKAHLDEMWLPFAASVIDSLLKFGFVVIAYEEDEESLVARSRARRERREPPAARAKQSNNLIPIVPPTDTYDVAYVMGGRVGYKRRYLCYSNAPNETVRVDEEVRIYVREHPDAGGNVNSPMAQIFDLGSFVAALTELAMTAEITLARPRIWTQMRKKTDGNHLNPGELFFDQESRAVQASEDHDENAKQVDALAMQQAMCKIINRLQTRTDQGPSGHQPHSFSGGGVATGKHSHVPQKSHLAIFSLPKEQEIAPSAGRLPQARGDLEGLSRLAIEQFGAAFGVPSDLLFQGKFASKSTAQLSLLNTTVSQLAKAVNQVLTIAYRDLYGEEESEQPTSLSLLTAPLAASKKWSNSFKQGWRRWRLPCRRACTPLAPVKMRLTLPSGKRCKRRSRKPAARTRSKSWPMNGRRWTWRRPRPMWLRPRRKRQPRCAKLLLNPRQSRRRAALRINQRIYGDAASEGGLAPALDLEQPSFQNHRIDQHQDRNLVLHLSRLPNQGPPLFHHLLLLVHWVPCPSPLPLDTAHELLSGHAHTSSVG